jgi:Amt family ammonium transporter
MSVNWSPPFWLWGYLIPFGLLLLTFGGIDRRKAYRITSLAGFSLAITALCYWAVGFAFHMGGAQAVHPDDPALKGLSVLFTLIPDQPGWGFIGLDAFFLAGDAIGPKVLGFFLSYLPLVATSVLLVSLALIEMRRWVSLVAGMLVATVVVPVALCWSWGSGWLAHLGETMGFGFGYVDFGGGSLFLWIPSMMVLGLLLVQKTDKTAVTTPKSPPTTYAPLLSNAGALLMGIGWMGWTLSNPFHIAGANVYWERTALNSLLGMAGAALTSQLYAWLILGTPEVLIAARGFAAGWAILLVGAPFLSPWLSFVLGLFSGLIFPFVHYAIESRSKLQSAAATLAMGITAGPVGVLSIALFADGRWGQGWNNISNVNDAALVDAVQNSLGVSGLFVSRDISQLKAQVIGLAALGLWGLLWGAVFGVFVRLFSTDKPSAQIEDAFTSTSKSDSDSQISELVQENESDIPEDVESSASEFIHTEETAVDVKFDSA